MPQRDTEEGRSQSRLLEVPVFSGSGDAFGSCGLGKAIFFFFKAMYSFTHQPLGTWVLPCVLQWKERCRVPPEPGEFNIS